jgi:hypothetical protein
LIAIFNLGELNNSHQGVNFMEAKLKLTKFLLGLLCLSTFIGCGQESSDPIKAGNVTVVLGSHSVASNTFLDVLFPPAYAALNQMDLCFKRLRFKIDDTLVNLPEDNVDISVKHVTLDSSGSSKVFQSIVIPNKTYFRLEFDLEDSCGKGYSARVNNDQLGVPVETDKRVTIKFTGRFNAANPVLTLSVQNIVDAVKNYAGAGGDDLKNLLEGTSGTF